MTRLELASSSFQYDVFINFRGEDTRHGFTGNLHNALKKAGVCTFFDVEDLGGGDEITPTLLNAIENSRMAITVFSKEYASSTFCLNELVKIHDCFKKEGLVVWPIFYDVEPSEVRHQNGNYGKALSMHIENGRADEDKIKSWKLALHEVANNSGNYFNPRQHYECQLIEEIVKQISRKLNRPHLHVCEYPIGLESRVNEITSPLQIGSNEKVIMVGICGMGGLGKTTVARALYNSIADNFEAWCFLHDVKSRGLKEVQEAILSNIVGGNINIEDVNKGVEVMKKRLKQRKILLILDDIDNDEQLKKLAGDCNWFGPGSRIIITSRDQHLLVRHGVESIYNMKAFNVEESLEFLKLNAFRSHQVHPNYNEVLNCVLAYAKGLPLALEVIGSSLHRMPTDEWESALEMYKRVPNKKIQQILKVSYEGLESVEKDIFLDIACFWKGEKLEHVKNLEQAIHGFHDLSYPIRVLKDKCLIKIDCYDCIQMHDLIRDMGREIVRQESPNEPGNRSRLWSHEDIIDVLEGNKGTDKVKMIVQDGWFEVNWDEEAFKNMKELRLLSFENVKFSKDPKYLPGSLKVLNWPCYPYSSFPPKFNPKQLIVLEVADSCLSSLETIIKNGCNLKILNLQCCEYIKEIPDLSNLKKLKELRLGSCENLIEIQGAVFDSPKLEILEVRGCEQLKTFPYAIRLPSLKWLDLSYCPSLKHFPEIREKMKIKELCLEGSGIEKLPWSIYNLSELRKLEIYDVIEIPNSIFHLPEIEEIIVVGPCEVISCNLEEAQEQAIWSKQCPNKLVTLKFLNCQILDDVLRSDLSRFVNVTELDFSNSDVTILPARIKECQFLKTLKLNECKYLREVEGIPPRLRYLEARNCVSLSSESKSLLLSEEVFSALDKYNSEEEKEFIFHICFPSRSIPKRFDKRSKGGSVSFWFRNSFPPFLWICVIKPAKEVLFPKVFINNIRLDHYCRKFLRVGSFRLHDHHLVVSHLNCDDSKRGGFWRENNWNHVEVETHWFQNTNEFLEESGIYLVKDLCDMDDITFQNPYLHHQTWDLDTCFDQEQVDTSLRMMKDKEEGALDKKRSFMGDHHLFSGSSAITCRKRGRFVSTNEDDDDNNNATTPQIIINNQEFQQPEIVTCTDDDEERGFEDRRKAKGKEIVIYNDTMNEH